MLNLLEIANGFINATRNEVGIASPEVEKLAAERYAVCLECNVISDAKLRCDTYKKGGVVKDFYNRDENQHFKKGDITHGCNCYLKLKTRSNSQCPLGKW